MTYFSMPKCDGQTENPNGKKGLYNDPIFQLVYACNIKTVNISELC